MPPSGYADWAWVQHMWTSATSRTGRVAVVLPQGALFRQGAEGRIRAHFLDADSIEAVIGLAPNLFYGTGLAACILILRRKKPTAHKNTVLFINAEDLFKRGRNQNTLEPEHAAAILESYRPFTDAPGRSHVATLDEIKTNGYNLSIPLYVEPADGGDHVTLEQALADLKAAHTAASASRAALEKELSKWGLGA